MAMGRRQPFARSRLILGLRGVPRGLYTITPPTGNPPLNTVAPVCSPATNLYVGSVITCTSGTWTGDAPISYVYECYVGGALAQSGFSNSYTAVTADIGKTIAWIVDATNLTGTVSANSNSTSAVVGPPVNTVLPSITPNTALYPGMVLTGNLGTWTNSPASYLSQFRRNGVAFGSNTALSYTLVASDIGATFDYVVSGVNPAGAGVAVQSAATSAVRWSPAALVGAGLSLWLDANDPTTIVSSGGLVSQWSDKSGNGRHAVQASGAQQPSVVTNVASFGGRTVIRFGGSQYLTGVGSITGSQLFGCTMTIAAAALNNARFVALANASQTASQSVATIVFATRSGTTDVIRAFCNNLPVTGSAGAIVVDTPFTWVVDKRAVEVIACRDGTGLQSTAITGALAVTGFGIGCQMNAGLVPTTNYHIGDCSEIVITTSNLTDADVQRMTGYLAWRGPASLVTALSSGHPYKNAPP